MCGIVGYIGSKKVVPLILDGLRRLEYRGYDSAGIAVVGNDGTVQIRRAPGKLHNLEEVVRQSPVDGSYGIVPLIHAFYAALEAGKPAPVGPEEGTQTVAMLRSIWPAPPAPAQLGAA